MIDLTREGDVFTMTLNAGENRWEYDVCARH